MLLKSVDSIPGGRLIWELEENSCIIGKFEDRASYTNQDMIYKLWQKGKSQEWQGSLWSLEYEGNVIAFI